MTVKILVADDSATMRQVMQMTFAGQDAEVVTVDGGDAAIQRAKEIRPDVVFADASMPTDGYAVAQAIKSDPALSNTAVIVLASQHHAFDEGRGRQAGVDDHVIKPFDSQVVIDKVGQVLGRPRAQAAAGAPAPAPRPVAAPAAAPPPPPRPPSGPTQAPSTRPATKSTVAFGAPKPPPAPPPVAAPPAAAAPPPAAAPPAAARPVLELADEPEPPMPAPAPAAAPRQPPAAAASAPARAAAAATGNGSSMAKKLGDLGLTDDQVQGVLALSREVIEQVVWEVVPDLAETIIREEIRRLTAD